MYNSLLYASDWHTCTDEQQTALLGCACLGGHKESIQYFIEELNYKLGEYANSNYDNNTIIGAVT